MPATGNDDPRIMGYNSVRRALGLIGLGLPVSLFAYASFSNAGMQKSISEFYYTAMGDVLVGSLCAIGIFLIAYRGYPRKPGEKLSDQVLATIAGIAAIGVALFPVSHKDGADCGTEPCITTGITNHPDLLHFASAGIFFVCLAVFCFLLFPKGARREDGSIDWTPANKTYIGCGSLIIVAILALGLFWLLGPGPRAALDRYNYVFWFETLGIAAFAISWLTKGKIVAGVKTLVSRR